MSKSADEHRAAAPDSLVCAVVTVSDSRTPETDTGGRLVAELLEGARHRVAGREIVADEAEQIAGIVTRFARREDVDAVLLTGGTGLSSRDHTYETVSSLLTKTMPGYGELFRTLSFAEVGAAAMLSRAVGGLIGQTIVLTMPGSPAGVRLAMEKLILPELSHMAGQARR